MNMDFGVFCKSTLDGEPVQHCISSIFGIAENADPSYLDWLMQAWFWTIQKGTIRSDFCFCLKKKIGNINDKKL